MPVNTRSKAFETRVRAFLTKLHVLLRAKGRCFVSGAFVVETTGSAKLQAFAAGLKQHSSRRLLAKTHNAFSDPAKLGKYRVCSLGARCRARVEGLTASPQYEYTLAPAMHGLCHPYDAFPKQVVLWYTFSMGGSSFLYMKLESHKGMSLAHVQGAVSRYVLKRQKPTAGYEVRRENAYKNSPTRYAAEALTASAKNRAVWAAMSPAYAALSNAYDASVRVGKELYVPPGAAAGLL